MVIINLEQCCGSGMNYSRSGSSFEFSEFWIQAKVPDSCGSGTNPYYLTIFGNYEKNTLNSTKKNNVPVTYQLQYLPFSISYTQSYTTHSPEFPGLYWEIISALSFFAGSGSETIILDPGKSFGSMRIRIHNAALEAVIWFRIRIMGDFLDPDLHGGCG